jgi:hypothetical protein
VQLQVTADMNGWQDPSEEEREGLEAWEQSDENEPWRGEVHPEEDWPEPPAPANTGFTAGIRSSEVEGDEQPEVRRYSWAENLAFIERPRMRGETESQYHDRLKIGEMSRQILASIEVYARTMKWAYRRRDQ